LYALYLANYKDLTPLLAKPSAKAIFVAHHVSFGGPREQSMHNPPYDCLPILHTRPYVLTCQEATVHLITALLELHLSEQASSSLLTELAEGLEALIFSSGSQQGVWLSYS
jgi:hypothetical protein